MGLWIQETPVLGHIPRRSLSSWVCQEVSEEAGPASALATGSRSRRRQQGPAWVWGGDEAAVSLGSRANSHRGAWAVRNLCQSPPEGFLPPCSRSVLQDHAPVVVTVSWPQAQLPHTLHRLAARPGISRSDAWWWAAAFILGPPSSL